MPLRILVTTWHEQGPAACARKLGAVTRMALPVMLRGRRTAGGVAAYFDLITDEGRLFYGDSFHFGYFRTGSETLAQALDAHTDLVAEMARPRGEQHILDVGCGLGAPAVRIAERYGCEITAVNISREQIRQGRQLIEQRQMSHRVRIVRGDARALDFPDGSFDAIVCLEAAGDICLSEEDKERFVCELHRVLRPGRSGRLFRPGPAHEPAADRQPHAPGGPLPPRRGARHRMAGALSPPGLHSRRSSGHHRGDDADLAPHPSDLRAATQRGRPSLRQADRRPDARSGATDPDNPHPLRNLPGALR